jgi:hypothetical protein
LVITENTVKVHLRNILDKLQLRNRQQAAAYAVQEGLVSRVVPGMYGGYGMSANGGGHDGLGLKVVPGSGNRIARGGMGDYKINAR